MTDDRTLAMAMCIRNEARFLEANLRYHYAVGVRQCYLFMDRCTDDCDRIASAFPWVRRIAIDTEDAARFSYVTDLMTACMDHALQLARRDEFEWLLTLDADEFAFADLPGEGSPLETGDLRKLVRGVDASVDMIQLQTKELVPCACEDADPFWKQHFFLVDDEFPRMLFDPVGHQTFEWRGFLSHNQGKSIVRTTADAQAYDSHRWVIDQGRIYPLRPALLPLKTAELGIHFHFFLVNQAHWREKYPKLAHEPEIWPCGNNVELPKQCWKRATTTLSDSDLSGYFNRWVGADLVALHQLAADRTVEERDEVETILEQSVSPATPNGKTAPCVPASTPAHGPAVWKPPETFWRDVFPQPTEEGAIVISLADIDPERLQGFYGVEYEAGTYFRWAQPHAEIRLELPRAPYDLTVVSGHLWELWNGNLRIAVNDGPAQIAARDPENQIVTVQLSSNDFTRRGEQRIRLIFDALDTNSWDSPEPRSLGAPITQLTLKPNRSGNWFQRMFRGGVTAESGD